MSKEAPKDSKVSPAEKLGRLKAVASHVGSQWTTVLYRQSYFHSMARSKELAEALRSTYAAHVHNTVTDLFVIDLIREIGALVLDGNLNSASVAVALKLLSDPHVLDELRKDYRIVLPSRWVRAPDLSEESRRAVEYNLEKRQIEENLKCFEQHLKAVTERSDFVLSSELSELLRVARNKSVAHYDIVRNGEDWKMWSIEDTRLTYGKLNEYVDACTAEVDALVHLVGQTDSNFQDVRKVSQEYANDYVDALVVGLARKRELEDHGARGLRDDGMTGVEIHK